MIFVIFVIAMIFDVGDVVKIIEITIITKIIVQTIITVKIKQITVQTIYNSTALIIATASLPSSIAAKTSKILSDQPAIKCTPLPCDKSSGA